jgi:phosphohistidine phosphatase
MSSSDPGAHRLYLLRHAESGNISADWRDAGRELTRNGRAQARAVGEVLADAGIGLVLCSIAVRARQTAALLGLPAPTIHLPALYNAGPRQVLAEVAEVEDTVTAVLVVAHAPGIPSLVYGLADPDSDVDALARIRPMYPPATLSGLEFTGSWSELATARLFLTRVPA